jgi:hypothetical protein
VTMPRGMPWNSDALAFPPWGLGLRLPAAPRRAICNGLGLFDAHNPWRSTAVRVTRGLVEVGVSRAWHWFGPREAMDPDWWTTLCSTVVEPVVGAVGSAALARRSDRFDVLLMDEDGVPTAFLKLGWSSESEDRIQREVQVLEHFAAHPPGAFRVPQVLASGEFEGERYRLFEPLPDGAHSRPAPNANRIASVVDEFRACLADLEKPPDIPGHYVPGHGDFTHRNLRLASDGDLWLFDWEYCEWMPPLADELRYWAAYYAFTIVQRPRASARKILDVLRHRGTADEIREAVAWPEFNRPAEWAIRQAVGRIAV